MPAIRKVLHMARITKEGLEACMAFGMASLAVAEIGESVAGQLPDGPPESCSPSSRPHTNGSVTTSTVARTLPCTPWR